MNRQTYQQALRYAGSTDWRTYRDTVHDAYIAFYDHTKKNLFDEDMGLVIATIKRVRFYNYGASKPTFMWRGRKYPNIMIRVGDTKLDSETRDDVYYPMIEEEHDSNIDVELYSKQLRKLLTKTELWVLDESARGVSQLEMAKSKGIDPRHLHYYVKQIRNKAKQVGIQQKQLQ